MKTSRTIHVVLLITVLLLGGMGRGQAADLEPSRPIIPDPALPEVVIEIPQSNISAKAFREFVLASVKARPSAFGLGSSFLEFTMLQMEQRRLSIPEPTQYAIEGLIQKQRAASGLSPDDFAKRIAAVGATENDLLRAARNSLLQESMIRLHRGLRPDQPLTEDDMQVVAASIRQRYAPVFHGLDANVAATVGGRDFGPDAVVDYSLIQGREVILNDLVGSLVENQVLLGFARSRGLEVGGKSDYEILALIYASELSPEGLKAYYLANREVFAIYRVRHIFVAFDPRPGRAYATSPKTPGIQSQALVRATRIVEALAQGDISFPDAAQMHSNCGTGQNGGDLGWLAQSRMILENLPPSVYQLDRLNTRDGPANPISLPPHAEILKAAMALKNSEVSGPIVTPTGYSIVLREAVRYPRDLGAIQPFLRRLRLGTIHDQTLAELRKRAAPGLRYHWTPASRPIRYPVSNR